MSRRSIGQLVGQNIYLIMATMLLLAAVLPVLSGTKVFAAGEIINGSTTASGVKDTPISLGDISITAAGNPTLPVQIKVPSGTLAMSTATGLTFTGSPTGSQVAFSGTKDDINAALATLSYTASSPGSFTIDISLTEAGDVFNPDNGHIYEYVDGPLVDLGEGLQPAISWDDAKTAAESMTKYGKTGYLITVTSQAESDYITPRLEGASWLGSSDAATEDDWRWVTGPEAGTAFWSGDPSGSPVGGAFTNWNSGEPNDAGDNEDCGQFLTGGEATGQWNDLPCGSGATLPGYVVEYGDNTPLAIANKAINVTVSAATVQVDTCEELESLDDTAGSELDNVVLTADIDCQGATVDALFMEDDYRGDFDGNGFTIRNVVIDDDISNIGIFSEATDANFHDINLENISATGYNDVGALVGDARDTSFSNIHGQNITVVTDDDDGAGGLVGDYLVESGSTSIVYVSMTNGSVYSHDGEAGGIVGNLAVNGENGEQTTFVIEQTYSELNVTSDGDMAGGLIGELDVYAGGGSSRANATVQDVYSWGSVSALSNRDVGGLIGSLDLYSDPGGLGAHATVQRAYASGEVSGNENVGGLIGVIDSLNSPSSITLANSFAMGAVTAGNTTTDGGLVGLRVGDGDASVVSTNNYFDQGGTGQADCESSNTLTGCTVVNVGNADPNYFINNKTNSPMDTWDFDTIWITNPGIPPIFGQSDATDLNIDGIPDEQQPNVGGYRSAITGKMVAIDVGGDCELTTDDMVRESQLAVQDPAYEYENGLWDFEADCGTPGYTTTIKLYYHDVSANGRILRKHNPTNNSFFTINDASITTTTAGGKTVTIVSYQVTDGGVRDIDGRVDGMIKDPAGLAQGMVGAPKTGL